MSKVLRKLKFSPLSWVVAWLRLYVQKSTGSPWILPRLKMQSFSSMPTKTGFIPETDSPKKKSPQPEAGHDLGSWQCILDDFFCICIKHLLKNEAENRHVFYSVTRKGPPFFRAHSPRSRLFKNVCWGGGGAAGTFEVLNVQTLTWKLVLFY